MLSAAQALAKASQVKSWAVGLCDNFVAEMYGFSASGYDTAYDNWLSTPTAMKHPGDTNPPPGALVYWIEQSGSGAGHVALSQGNGMIYSTDISGNGTVSSVPLSEINQKWGLRYLGWASPYFQGKAGTTEKAGSAGSSGVQTEPVGFVSNILSIPKQITNAFAAMGKFFDWLDWIFVPSNLIRLALGAAGVLSFGTGIYLMASEV